ncbi:hypothetical protein [Roseateles sp. LYH14W]|uniref:Uncharacterized protein n=1 Tax=Pelomonas parva TaxID=3299032 RepID=A0ABW7F9N2_9BURK
MNRLLLACLIAPLGQVAEAAPMPRLDKAAPTLCPATDNGTWNPSAAQVAALEKSLPAFFAASKAASDQLPDSRHVYRWQYSGYSYRGQRRIFASFYPAADPLTAAIKPGTCMSFSDGGNAFWHLEFDPRSGKVVRLQVNGVA